MTSLTSGIFIAEFQSQFKPFLTKIPRNHNKVEFDNHNKDFFDLEILKRILERLVHGQPRSNVDGNCIIFEEFWRQPKEVEFEQINLYRICDKYLATPYNFYSTMVTNVSSMAICDTDLCNQT